MAAQALSTVATTSKCINQLSHRGPNWTTKPQSLHRQWIGTPIKISIQSHNFKPVFTKHCSIKAICWKPEPEIEVSKEKIPKKPEIEVSKEKIPKWSLKAIHAFAMAELQAKRMKFRTTGTQGLLVGMSIDGTNFASQYLRANNITLFKLRDEINKIFGKNDFENLWIKSPNHPPLTEDAQKALDWAVDEKLKNGGNGEITTAHMLLGVWAQKESPGYMVLSTLGFNDEKAQELMDIISQPGFVEEY